MTHARDTVVPEDIERKSLSLAKELRSRGAQAAKSKPVATGTAHDVPAATPVGEVRRRTKRFHDPERKWRGISSDGKRALLTLLGYEPTRVDEAMVPEDQVASGDPEWRRRLSPEWPAGDAHRALHGIDGPLSFLFDVHAGRPRPAQIAEAADTVKKRAADLLRDLDDLDGVTAHQLWRRFEIPDRPYSQELDIVGEACGLVLGTPAERDRFWNSLEHQVAYYAHVADTDGSKGAGIKLGRFCRELAWLSECAGMVQEKYRGRDGRPHAGGLGEVLGNLQTIFETFDQEPNMTTPAARDSRRVRLLNFLTVALGEVKAQCPRFRVPKESTLERRYVVAFRSGEKRLTTARRCR